jgi:hypothetical protein
MTDGPWNTKAYAVRTAAGGTKDRNRCAVGRDDDRFGKGHDDGHLSGRTVADESFHDG